MLIPGCRVDLAIVSGNEDVQLVRVACDGGDGRAGLSGQIEDAPPAAPLRVVHVLVPGGRVDSAVGAHDEGVELVGIARHGRDRTAGWNFAGENVPPTPPLAVRYITVPGRGVGLAVATRKEEVQLVRIARDRGDGRSFRRL